jgi:IS5 family transposase
VIQQIEARVFAGDTRAEGKIVSLFEPTTEVIRKGRPASRPNSAKWSSCRRCENQIVIAYEI